MTIVTLRVKVVNVDGIVVVIMAYCSCRCAHPSHCSGGQCDYCDSGSYGVCGRSCACGSNCGCYSSEPMCL